MRSSSFTPYPPKRPASGLHVQTVKGVTDFLQAHEKMGLLLPTVTRLATLQKACTAALPVLFDNCMVLHYDTDQLVLAAPNAAIISKLRQKLPKLQEFLRHQGWQVNVIRLKVQVGNISEKSTTSKQLILSNRAVSAFSALEDALEPSSRNTALKAALQAMILRHRSVK